MIYAGELFIRRSSRVLKCAVVNTGERLFFFVAFKRIFFASGKWRKEEQGGLYSATAAVSVIRLELIGGRAATRGPISTENRRKTSLTPSGV